MIMRVLKKCYDFSLENSPLLVPIKSSSDSNDSSIYYTLLENNKCWESTYSNANKAENLQYKTSGYEFFNQFKLENFTPDQQDHLRAIQNFCLIQQYKV